MQNSKTLLALLVTLGLTAACQAQDLSPTIPRSIALPGTTSTDGWNDLTATANPGFPGFPGSAPWPNPIGSNTAGSGDATLDKIAGNAYPGGSTIYFGGFSSAPNTFGGTLTFSDITTVANLQTVVLQLQIGQAFGYDFYNGVLPTLSYNAGTQNLAATFSQITAQVQNGTFDPGTGAEPVYVRLYALQWDLSAIADPVTSLSISFSGVQHSQLYAAQIDQSSVFSQVVAVPEPHEYALGIAGLLLAVITVRRRRTPQAA